MTGERNQRNSARWRTLAVVAAGVALAFVLLCGSAGIALRRGAVAAPTIHQHAGSLTLHAVTTLDPQCPMAFCGVERINSSLQQYYVAWLEVVRDDGQQITVTQIRLLEMPIDVGGQ